MRQIKAAIAGILALFTATAAAAQTFPTVPANTVIGRLGTGPGPAQAIPNATLFSANLFDTVLGSTRGSIPYRGAGGWTGLPPGAAGSLLQSGGTGADPSWLALPLPIAKGGTGQITAPLARGSSGLNIDQYTGHGDSIYTILSTDRTVGTSAAFTASRTWTLPAASSVNAGQEIAVVDYFGGATSVNTLVVARSGSDTINGATSVTVNAAYGGYRLRSDGVSKWSADAISGSSATLFKTPMDYGAACNGTTDDKTALQAWLTAISGTYVGMVPPGKTCTWGNGSNGSSGNGLIFVGDNTTIIGNGSTFKILATAPLNSGFMVTDPTQGTATGPSNVRISGLNFDGNKAARGCTTTPGPTQCSAATFFAVNAQDLWLENSKCINGAADCFYVGGDVTKGGPSRRVYLNNITCLVATRNCLSIVGVLSMAVNGCHMSGALTAPGHGIDVEPDSTNTLVNDLTISHCTLQSNGGDGISINPAGIVGGVNRGLGFMIMSNSNTGNGFSQYTTAKALNGWKFAGAFGASNGTALFAVGPSVAADSLP